MHWLLLGLLWIEGSYSGWIASKLEVLLAGGLVLRSHNSSVGRSRWHRSIDLRGKDDALRVTRERFVAYDTIDAELDRDCSVDLGAAGADVALWQWSYERPPCA